MPHNVHFEVEVHIINMYANNNFGITMFSSSALLEKGIQKLHFCLTVASFVK